MTGKTATSQYFMLYFTVMDLDQEPGVRYNHSTDPVKIFYVCLQLFDFDNLSLDEALRLFLSRFCLVGETQVWYLFKIYVPDDTINTSYCFLYQPNN